MSCIKHLHFGFLIKIEMLIKSENQRQQRQTTLSSGGMLLVVKSRNIRIIMLFTGCTSSATASRICGEQGSGSESTAATEVSATNSVRTYFVIFAKNENYILLYIYLSRY